MKKTKKLISVHFCPTGDSAYFMRKHGHCHNYNWRGRGPSIFDNGPLNELTIGKIFSFLHYKSSHAPEAVNKKWDDAADRFMQRHMPGNANMRFGNKFTAHRWL